MDTRAVRFFVFIQLLLLLIVQYGCSVAPYHASIEPGNIDLGKTKRYSIDHDNRKRFYYLHEPASTHLKNPLPLVVVLHSAGGNPNLIEERTKFSQYADRDGFLVVYPAGIGLYEERFLAWNAGYCCFISSNHDVDDVDFVQAVIKSVQHRYSVDESRIYLAGFSNGGMLSYRLATETKDIFSAVAVVSGAIGGKESPEEPINKVRLSRQPMPMLIMHGEKDEQVPYMGGTAPKTTWDRVDLSLLDAVSYWKKNNHCSDVPARKIIAGGRVLYDSYSCSTGAELNVYVIRNGGHAWPSEHRPIWRLEYMMLDEPTTDIVATEEILNFFRRY